MTPFGIVRLLAPRYQLAQSVLKVGFALAKKKWGSTSQSGGVFTGCRALTIES